MAWEQPKPRSNEVGKDEGGVRRRAGRACATAQRHPTGKADATGSGTRDRSVDAATEPDGRESEVVVHDESRYGTVRAGRVYEGRKIEMSTQSAGAWQCGQHRGNPAGGSAGGATSTGPFGRGEVVGAGGIAARAAARRVWRPRLASRP